MSEMKKRSIVASIVGLLTLCAGLAAFLVPLQHAGPYGIPGRGLIGGLLCFAISAVLLARGAPRFARGAALVASPFVLFFALYGALAELEEVVNSDFFLTSHTLPHRLLLFCKSPWLIEIAQFLARFGSQVILATSEKSLLSEESKTIATRLRKVLKEEGIEIKTQASIEKVNKKKDGLHVTHRPGRKI